MDILAWKDQNKTAEMFDKPNDRYKSKDNGKIYKN